jgi:hypothetical protein
MKFFLLTFLRYFQNSQIIYRSLQAAFIIFSLYWQSEAYTTCIGPFEKSLFLHKPPSVKSARHSPPLSHQENATEKYQSNNFSGIPC